jgi:hypothetical protein
MNIVAREDVLKLAVLADRPDIDPEDGMVS